MRLSSWISSTDMPLGEGVGDGEDAAWRGVARARSRTSSNRKASGSRPCTPMSSMRSAFCSTSGKVRPMAITSPTLFISLPMRVDAPRNLPRSQRGTLQTM